jgi:hypothetical protein
MSVLENENCPAAAYPLLTVGFFGSSLEEFPFRGCLAADV